MAFSGALTLTDLNDFITPSQACIKPVDQTNRPAEERDKGAAATEIRVDASGSYYEVSSQGTSHLAQPGKRLETAQISLNDCLACSGCITSAESVLITLQSHTEVLNFLAQNPPAGSSGHKIPILSIAPQSLASLAAAVSVASSSSSSSTSALSVPLHRVLARVRAFCTRELGFQRVYDTTLARHISLLEHVNEFWERKTAAAHTHAGSEEPTLPMLASACPGWVCYAEKTHGEMLPFVSRSKSPQQVMGTLVKNWLGDKWGQKPDEIYHVTVMPCYDKKLEASRQDFYNEAYATRDVDCVLTTGELELMMRERGWDLSVPVPGEDDLVPISPPTGPSTDPTIPELLTHEGSSSGSYLATIIASVHARAPQGASYTSSVRTIRNADYEEHVLRDEATGAVVFRGAKCYGFRNLQNVVRKVGKGAGVQVGRGAAGRMVRGAGGRRRGKEGVAAGEEEGTYDYVEVMACPSGCVNGGGQLKPSTIAHGLDEEGHLRDWAAEGVSLDGATATTRWGDREWTKRVEAAYWSTGLPTPPPSPPLDPATPSAEEPDPGAVPSALRSVRTLESMSARAQAMDGDASQSRLRAADALAAQILRELCAPASSADVPVASEGVAALGNGGRGGGEGWLGRMDARAEERRVALFRTQYRAVESEVVGLAVKW